MKKPVDIWSVVKAEEQQIAEMLGEVWNAYLKLPVDHPCERDEFCKAIHACQNIVLSRPAVRAMAKAQEKANG